MANSKFEYVRGFEQPDNLIPNTWIVVRIDGRGFSKFTSKYEFLKPNDKNGLDVMNAAAVAVMKELPDLVLAFGNSDEYRTAPYSNDEPGHINNLYNTTFWTLVQQGGMGAREAEQRLKGTVSSDKNEILFKEFGINYNNEPECFKKGTVLYRDFFPTPPTEQLSSPVLSDFPTPPIAQPTPKRASNHQASQSIERSIPYLPDKKEMMENPGLCRRPTFLSTTSTPSPPPSPPTISRSAFPNPLRSNPIGSDGEGNMPVKPPSIPLRISSIPANSKPRKLSLPVHRSTSTLKATRDTLDEKESIVTPGDATSTPPRKVSPPIQKNKALPSPPMSAEEEMRTREKVKGNSPWQDWSKYAINGSESPQRRPSDSDNRAGQGWGTQDHISHPGIAELHAFSTPTQSAPTSATLPYPHSGPDLHTLISSTSAAGPSSQAFPTSRPSTSSRNKDTSTPKPSKSNSSKARPDKGKQPQSETNSKAAATAPQQANEGWPVPMSRTQRDKDKKKRSKAMVLMEHVDIIKDDFWEKRPWILSGKTG
ncbi:hypothetical protein J4E90_004102 [Alternaria incomplexa]|uniref:uncharacterized protein n=1 Tax=Alternaria incomplexa TaxID=1187928 RepID=UPI00221F2AA4|nr:uncharacterized protein J4E90_004102 [Alternaria incomplexa]KAI4915657.1 hypothetical protein J4E90_004102 [Alternaria incomplexa]